jgi:hypothetical protein
MDLRILEGMGPYEERSEEERGNKEYLSQSRNTNFSVENVI